MILIWLLLVDWSTPTFHMLSPLIFGASPIYVYPCHCPFSLRPMHPGGSHKVFPYSYIRSNAHMNKTIWCQIRVPHRIKRRQKGLERKWANLRKKTQYIVWYLQNYSHKSIRPCGDLLSDLICEGCEQPTEGLKSIIQDKEWTKNHLNWNFKLCRYFRPQNQVQENNKKI